MRQLGYVGMLAFCLLGTLPLELVLGVRVYRQWRRLALTLLCVVPVFVAWDLYAVDAGSLAVRPRPDDRSDAAGRPALEELLFFLVIPICSVLALEAVRRVRGWPVGDERVSYTALALVGAVAAVVLDLVVLRTRLLTRRVFWTAYAIIVVFQLVTNGWLTGRDIVTYDDGRDRRRARGVRAGRGSVVRVLARRADPGLVGLVGPARSASQGTTGTTRTKQSGCSHPQPGPQPAP